MATITSAAGALALLDEPEYELKAFALAKLSDLVDDFWAEIADSIPKIEALYEDEAFPLRFQAALLASRVFFHLGELEMALEMALCAGVEVLPLDANNLYVSTIIAQAMDKYTTLRAHSEVSTGSASVDERLEGVVNGMFERCIQQKEYKHAIGVALEARRFDILSRSLSLSPSLLSYAYDLAMTLAPSRAARNKALQVIAQFYALDAPSGSSQNSGAGQNNSGASQMETESEGAEVRVRDIASACQIAAVLGDVTSVAQYLVSLASGATSTASGEGELEAFQLAFDLYSRATQHFLADVCAELARIGSSLPPVTLSRLSSILLGHVTRALEAHFLTHSRHTDEAILTHTLPHTRTSSVLHQGAVMANAWMNAGTGSEDFLRTNKDWLVKATNWAKFSAVASLGVIHKGQTHNAMNLLAPYLPREHGDSGSPYERAGSLYALGLISSSHGASLVPYLSAQLAAGTSEIVQHGASLGLSLAAMASGNMDVYAQLKGILYTDSAVAGEAAGLGIGLVMLASGNEQVLSELTTYAADTQHEKIIRGLSVGIPLVMYGRKEEADGLIEKLVKEKDAILRVAACNTIAMAYAGTNDNKAIKQLLHLSVSDVSDDVRRTAVTSLGFLLMRTPEQLPSVVMLLCESFNPHVRFGACLSLALACAGTGLSLAIDLVEPLLKDPVPFVRQGACVSLAMIMLQQQNSHPKSDELRKKFASIVGEKHEDVLCKFGAVYAQGILEAGGRNVTISVCREHGHMDMSSVVGLLVFTQFWSWFPLAHFLSLAFTPTAVICVNKDLKMPKMELKSCSPASVFAYPPAVEVPKEKEKDKVVTAVLSISAKNKAKEKKREADKEKKGGEAEKEKKAEPKAEAMEVDEAASKAAEEAKKAEESKKKEEDFEILANPVRAVPAQVKVLAFPAGSRYVPVRPEALRASRVVVVRDTQQSEKEDLIEVQVPSSPSGGAGASASEGEPSPPPPFEFSPDTEEN